MQPGERLTDSFDLGALASETILQSDLRAVFIELIDAMSGLNMVGIEPSDGVHAMFQHARVRAQYGLANGNLDVLVTQAPYDSFTDSVGTTFESRIGVILATNKPSTASKYPVPKGNVLSRLFKRDISDISSPDEIPTDDSGTLFMPILSINGIEPRITLANAKYAVGRLHNKEMLYFKLENAKDSEESEQDDSDYSAKLDIILGDKSVVSSDLNELELAGLISELEKAAKFFREQQKLLSDDKLAEEAHTLTAQLDDVETKEANTDRRTTRGKIIGRIATRTKAIIAPTRS